MDWCFGDRLHDLIQIRFENFFNYRFGFIVISKSDPLTCLIVVPLIFFPLFSTFKQREYFIEIYNPPHIEKWFLLLPFISTSEKFEFLFHLHLIKWYQRQRDLLKIEHNPSKIEHATECSISLQMPLLSQP